MASASEPTPQLTRLSINLATAKYAPLRDYASRKGVSVTEAVRRAVFLLDYVDRAQDRGAVLNVVEPDGKVRELVMLG